MPELNLDWLDALPDMRISGVPGVPGVEARKSDAFSGTPERVAGCGEVFHHTLPHLPTPVGVALQPAENRHSTPGTPPTPNFDDDADQMVVIARGLVQLRRLPPPADMAYGQWMIIVGDAIRLRDDGWVDKAFGLGWSVIDLFGTHGLAGWLDCRRVSLLDADGAHAGPWCRGFMGPLAGRFRRSTTINSRATLLWDYEMDNR